MDAARPPFAYIVPLRRWVRGDLAEFGSYLAALPPEAEVLVVDGSASGIFAAHANALPSRVRHLAISPENVTPNGKVGGVVTGIGATSHERVVVADDDVRYAPAELAAVVARLDWADVVRPQNYFAPLPWHARWDTARMLLNRMSGGDWPGTLALRRSVFLRVGGYAGDVLFENYELVRTLRRSGAREALALDLFVRRLPPQSGRFAEQRVRQAYDEFARPLRLCAYLAVLPLLAFAVAFRAWRLLGACTAAIVLLAEAGRRRDGGSRYFPWTASLLAPGWLLERAVCSWLALAYRRAGGMPYAGTTLRCAAT